MHVAIDMLERDGILRGMTAGLITAGVMSAARLLAHRAGLIERMVPPRPTSRCSVV